MLNIKKTKEDNKLAVAVEGRLDTTTAPEDDKAAHHRRAVLTNNEHERRRKCRNLISSRN